MMLRYEDVKPGVAVRLVDDRIGIVEDMDDAWLACVIIVREFPGSPAPFVRIRVDLEAIDGIIGQDSLDSDLRSISDRCSPPPR